MKLFTKKSKGDVKISLACFKVVLFCLMLSTTASAMAQAPIFTECGGAVIIPDPAPLSVNCARQSPDFTGKYSLLSNYIPNPSSDPVKIIKLSFNIFQDDNGNGNFIDDYNPAVNGDKDKYWLINNLFPWINEIYAVNAHFHNGQPSDPVPGVMDLSNTRIQFDLGPPGQERIYFYKDDDLWNKDDLAGFQDAVATDQSRINPFEELNIYFSAGYYQNNPNSNVGGYAPYPNYNFNWNMYIVNFRAIGGPGGLPGYSSAQNIAHELGHCLQLGHTYDSGAPCSGPDYLDDVFGPLGSICPHSDCGDGFISPNDGCTNNLMGGNWTEYYSPKQIGKMHRSLALKTVRKYLKECVYNTNNPLVVSNNELWDFDIQLDRDIFIQPGSTLTLSCKVSLPDGAKIVVQPGASLILDGATITNNCMGAWDGTIEVYENSQLILQPGSEIRLRGNGKIQVEDIFNLGQNKGKLVYNQNAQILLNDPNTIIEIKGDMEIGANAVFTFTGSGHIAFENTHTLAMGAGSSINITGVNKTNKIIHLRYSTTLNINGHNVTLKNGKIDYEQYARLELSNGSAFFDDMTFQGNIWSVGFYGNNLTSFDLRDSDFNNFNKGVHIENSPGLNVPLKFRSSDFNACVTAIKGSNLGNVSMSAIKVDGWGAPASIPSTGIDFSATNKIETNNCIFSFCDKGVKLDEVPGFYLSSGDNQRGRVYENQTGIYAVNSLVFIRNGARVDNNWAKGVEMYGEYTPIGKRYTSMLTVGDQGCGGIYNNGGTGIFGSDFILNIDAVQHALNQGTKFTKPNRFDNNGSMANDGLNLNFKVCYTNYQVAPTQVLAKGNFWGSNPQGTMGLPMNPNKYKVKNHCNPNPSGGIPIDASSFSTCIPVNVCTGCPSSGGGSGPIPDPIDNAQLLSLFSCQAPINPVKTINEEYSDANELFIPSDTITTRMMFQNVADIELIKTGNTWKGKYPDNSELVFSNVCVHLVQAAKVILKGTGQNKTGENDDEGQAETVDNSNIKVHPNPAEKELNIAVTGDDLNIYQARMFNLLGEEVYRGTFVKNATINLEQLRVKGIYFLETTCVQGNKRKVEKIIVQ